LNIKLLRIPRKQEEEKLKKNKEYNEAKKEKIEEMTNLIKQKE